ncbi:MAG: RNA polymerase sigma-70 factor [Chitinophagaceae bacterium]|nr:RNA polymerase sigma-70 factor [Chitinophagaceae bacterium]
MDLEKEFSDIFQEYYPALCRYALKIVRKEELAEDVVQEVFVNLWEKRNKIDIAISIKSYLYTSVRNRSINQLKLLFQREQKKEKIYENMNISEDISDILKQNELQNTYEIVQEAIETLPPKCKIIFLLSREEYMTYALVAKELNISIKTVENQIIIAFKKIRIYIQSKNQK